MNLQINFAEKVFCLSDNVWDYTRLFKREIEMGLDLGIRSGQDAASMARDLKQYLQHPDKLFRRVRDEHGNLHLSKAAADFHPGRGVYRSSYMNARRLAATETNIAYRTADHERMKNLDFVVGIEVHLSNNHTCKGRDGKPHPFTDICDELKGKYPKDFKFTGWHPHCRCYVISVLKTDEEIAEDTKRILRGEPVDGESENKVEDVPEGYKKWVEKNEERIKEAREKGTLPYFVRDNEEMVSGMKVMALSKSNATVQKEQKPEEKSAMTDIIEKLKQLLSPMARKLYVAFEPFSPIIAEMLAKLRDKKKKLKLFRELLEDERVEVINDTGKAKTVVFPGHKGIGKSSWKAVCKAAEYINKSGDDVIFLPEEDNEKNADALILFNGIPVLADFKCPTKYNWNTLQDAIDYGFGQAGNIVLFADGVKFDTNLINDALGYLQRNKTWVGNVMIINEYGKIKKITFRDIKRGKYRKMIKGFL